MTGRETKKEAALRREAELRERIATYTRRETAARDRGDFDVAEKHWRTAYRLRGELDAHLIETAAVFVKRGRKTLAAQSRVELRDGMEFRVVVCRKGRARGIRESRPAFTPDQRVARTPVRGDAITTTESGVWLAAGSR